MESAADRRTRVKKIIKTLDKEYPDARCLLDFRTPLELLIATILAAQCTDERVNQTTPELFEAYDSAEDFANASLDDLETIIRSCGTFRQKAKSIKNACQAIVERNDGHVPKDVERLSDMPGVGRKTANVVMGCAFGVPSLIVDTHVLRLSGRLELASQHNVEKKYADKVEAELQEVVPEQRWTDFSHLLSFHGRQCCTARKPHCPECAINELCPYPDKTEADA
jgi:endonuclease-3